MAKCRKCNGVGRGNIPFMGLGRCPDCNGTGAVEGKDKVVCPKCMGRRDTMTGAPCEECRGDGEIDAVSCAQCSHDLTSHTARLSCSAKACACTEFAP